MSVATVFDQALSIIALAVGSSRYSQFLFSNVPESLTVLLNTVYLINFKCRSLYLRGGNFWRAARISSKNVMMTFRGTNPEN